MTFSPLNAWTASPGRLFQQNRSIPVIHERTTPDIVEWRNQEGINGRNGRVLTGRRTPLRRAAGSAPPTRVRLIALNKFVVTHHEFLSLRIEHHNPSLTGSMPVQ